MEQDTSRPEAAIQTRLERAPFIVVLVLVFFLPFFFIPSSVVPLEAGKGVLVYTAVILAAVLAVLAILRRGQFSVPWTSLSLGATVLALVTVLAALVSSSPVLSLIGNSFSSTTATTIVAGAVLLFVVASAIKSNIDVVSLYTAVLASSVVVALIHATRLVFGPGVLSFGVLTTAANSLVGMWNELAIFFGLIALLSLITLELMKTDRLMRVLMAVLLGVSLVVLVIVQFQAVWYAVGIFSLVLLLYRISVAGKGGSFPVSATLVLALAVVFVLAGGALRAPIADALGTASVDVRPSSTATLAVAEEVLRHNPFLGVGPNRFYQAWLLYKPEGVNTTAFWAVPFNSGVGLVPSALVTTGVLGFAAWLFLLGSLMLLGARSLFQKGHDAATRYSIVSSFLLSLYLWLFVIVYTPNILLLTFAFLFTGIFLAVLLRSHIGAVRTVDFAQQPTQNFAVTLVAVVVVIGAIVGGYTVGTRFIATVLYGRGTISFAEGSLEAAERSFVRSVQFSESDVAHRALTQVQAARLTELLSQTDTSQDVLRNQFQTLLGTAIANAQRATVIDPDNHLGWVTLGGIYEQLVSLEVAGAYESARDAYGRAQALNPHGPDMELLRARLEIVRGDREAAREHIGSALARKPNYTDAIFLLSQIDIAEGNIDDAIASVETATLLDPNNPVVFFQLGLLRYSNREYAGAAGAFEAAVALSSFYANARYFLGLSYDQLGRRQDAITQFENVALLNPDNQEVQFILSNLRAGREPFADAEPPLDVAPELREKPPLSEPIVEDEATANADE